MNTPLVWRVVLRSPHKTVCHLYSAHTPLHSHSTSVCRRARRSPTAPAPDHSRKCQACLKVASAYASGVPHA